MYEIIGYETEEFQQTQSSVFWDQAETEEEAQQMLNWALSEGELVEGWIEEA